jgi:hypothetical protein
MDVRLKRPDPGQRDPMAKEADRHKRYQFAIKDPETGLTWCYECAEVKDRGRRRIVVLGIVDENRIKQADEVFVCADCGAIVEYEKDLLPMSDLEKKAAPNLRGHCPKPDCEGYCLLTKKADIGRGPNVFENRIEVSDERH